ncbi:MAG TPA: hypothetical protein VG537_01265 [Candidatus Kapabacteria bacterium]|nr:hypothetical protein [Candidatus Kapabacteria bacterium]
MRFSFILLALGLWAAALSSCCQPGHKNSQPVVVDSLFQESYAYDLDIYSTQLANGIGSDSGYHPIYTFGIANTGPDDDDFTLQIRLNGAGFDITKHVPAGDTVLFETPVAPPNSITMNAKYFYPILAVADTIPLMPEAYYGMFVPSPDSTKIRSLRPDVRVLYGAIDNGPEACNTPPSEYNVNIDALPDR